MRILINDTEDNKESYHRIFQSVGYERNELIFRSGWEDTRVFITQQLEKRKLHVDGIITNKDAEDDQQGPLQADQLCFLKNQLVSSCSGGNLRIAAIPLILYSTHESKEWSSFGYDAVVEKNKEGDHRYFIRQCESVIRQSRRQLLEDLEGLRLKIGNLLHFPHSKIAKDYFIRVTPRADYYFSNVTKALSLEFIKSPAVLPYDWLRHDLKEIEQPYDQFLHTLKHHLKYGGKVTERTVWHALLRKYSRLLLRDVHNDFLYEKNLRESAGRESQECDFILTTEFPDLLNTTFLEVKREDKQYYVNKSRKRPTFTRAFQRDLNQIWDYYKYTINPEYQTELVNKVGYATKKFDFLLLAGRREEKEEMQDVFETDLADHYQRIQVQSFEDFADTYANYINKFTRLSL